MVDPKAEIIRERKAATVDSYALGCLLHGGQANLDLKIRTRAQLEADPLFDKSTDYFLDREAKWTKQMERAVKVFRDIRDGKVTSAQGRILATLIGDYPFAVHNVMFVPTLEGQANEDQQRLWLNAARSFAITGTYAQTELGHGTNIRALETTATYDPDTQQFIINSPTVTSTKWWPGGLGKSSNSCVVVARLITRGQDHGIHTFFVQIRDYTTHQPLPGVEVGDIGIKMGYEAVDNGYLRFNNIRIPRSHLLSKHAKVEPNGEYIKPKHDKIGYGTMLFVRAHLVNGSSNALKAATTIAIRYSAVRRQSEITGGKEVQVLDFQQQQYQLFGLLATAYAFHFTGARLLSLYESFVGKSGSGDIGLLGETHFTSSGLKAYATSISVEGIETCRRCCGGHGYSKFSGFSDIYESWAPSCTYEGDNIVMFLQGARFLIKAYEQVKKGGSVMSVLGYLSKPQSPAWAATSKTDAVSVSLIQQLFEHRATFLIARAAGALKASVASGLSATEAWNACAFELVAASKAHCEVYVLESFAQILANPAVASQSFKGALHNMFVLFAYTRAEASIGDFTADGFVSPAQVSLIRDTVRTTLGSIRPEAVALVDAFQLSDNQLNSCLGRYDGNVYETMFAWAKKEPLNKKEVPDGVTQHLLPFIQENRALLSKL